jgi:hypothetical protein
MIPKTSEEQYQKRIKEMIDYITTTNSFPTRGVKDIRFSDDSCLMGEWFKTNRNKLKVLSETNQDAFILVKLSDKYMKKTDKKNVDDRFNLRIKEMIDFVNNNNYFPTYEDSVKFDDNSTMYVWYYTNKKRIKASISQGDIYAKELYSLEQRYRRNKLKNKYPKVLNYQNKEYTLKEFAKYLNITNDDLIEYLQVFCKDIYNIKQPELERIRNTVLNINRLKNMVDKESDVKDIKLNKFIKKYNLDSKIIITHFDKLINMGLSKEESLLSIKNEFNNNNNKISVDWIYDAYEELNNSNNLYDRNYVVNYMLNTNLSLYDALLKILIDVKLSNYREPKYIKDVIFYTIKSNDYETTKNYTESLFKLDDFHINMMNSIKQEYDKVVKNDNEQLDRSALLEELINNYDYYNENKNIIKEQYNLSKYEIMFIEVRKNELDEKRHLRKS